MLAMLALRANRVVSVDQLIDVVWGDDPPPTARGQVQTSVSVLRKLLADAGMPNAIKTRSSGYVLEVGEDDLDSKRFGALVATAHRQAAENRIEQAAETLSSALGLWRGPVFDGLHNDLIRNAAAVFEEARLTAAEERVRLELELGRHAAVTGELRSLVAEHPWRERLYSFLMVALYRSGRQAEALEVYRQAWTVLTTEVGIEPGQELRDLERAVLCSDGSLDLRPAEPEAGPPAVEEPARTPRQLPGSIADFVGREDHIADVVGYLTGRDDGAARYAVPIVAVSGRGGVGKSTLALRVAHEVGGHFPDGHLYVDLRGPDRAEGARELLGRFLRALGTPDAAVPHGLEERASAYRSRLADKRVLVVVDNATDEEQVLPLLPGSPTCGVVVTSRSRLVGLPGAHGVEVEPLDPESATGLLARLVGAERVRAEERAVADIVRYSGGLPLAVRIAGARLAARPHRRIGELAGRMADEDRRLDEFSHQGVDLRSSIDLTHRGLAAPVRRLLRLLALTDAPDFPGWTAAALLDTSPGEAEELLDELVEARLLAALRDDAGRVRYRFHDLIRAYARERLAEAEPAAARRDALARVLGGWLSLAEAAHRKEHGDSYVTVHGRAPRRRLPEWAEQDPVGDPAAWLADERGALVAAIRQAAAVGLSEPCWDLALTAAGLFEVRGHPDDWREALDLVHAAALRAGDRTGTAATRYAFGALHLAHQRLDDADASFAEALDLFVADGNVPGEAMVLRARAVVDRRRGRFDPVRGGYETALDRLREVGDLVGQAAVRANLARFQLAEGEVRKAKALLNEALELYGRADHRRGEADVLCGFAELYLHTHQLALCRQALSRGLRTARDLGDRSGEAYALYCFGLVRRDEGQLDGAAATLAHARNVGEDVGNRLVAGLAGYALGEIALVQVENTAAAEHLERARDVFDALGSVLWLARTHLLLSEAHAAAGAVGSVRRDLDRAAGLLSGVRSRQADRLRRQVVLRRAAHLPAEAAG
ncbi:BTAD domain-containing putative transcriptional regulator [Actinosynnema sp. NPDC059335]|uniref:AfsR/SARP family transcriptional regulator n=1 Tax=Actinosynnema sp. NPDC059335 TaxID=3346804 RepID=UPI003671EBD8